MTLTYTHYTTMGATMAPSVADAEGFIAWRKNYETLPMATWTRSERWIDAQERWIAQAR